MKCSVFIATSLDGYIATESGCVAWLESFEVSEQVAKECADMGFNDYISQVDCLIMGRKTFEKLLSFNLTAEQWPYGSRPIFVLSNSLKTVPSSLPAPVEIYSGDIPRLLTKLSERGYKHAYIDGGSTITAC